MKKASTIRPIVWLMLALTVILSLCLFACTPDISNTETDTDVGTSSEGTAAPEAATHPVTETPEETTAPPEELKGWEQDTGKFNEGIIEYEKVVSSTSFDAYPDDQLGKLMSDGDTGVIRTFHSDFSDLDPTCGGEAAVRSAGDTVCVDGKLYSPYDASSPTLTGGGWTTWAPNPSSSVKQYKQAQLSVDWSIVSAGEGAWLNAMWGCYVSNYTFKIPDGPGDGLWISFSPRGNKLTVYHPEIQYITC